MRFAEPLIRARLLRRYKRFLADVELESGETVTAHCANPGSMMGLSEPGIEVWLAPVRNPKAKLPYRWEMARIDGHLVGINTGHPNRIVAEAVAESRIPELAFYDSLRREVRYGRNSRIDLLLEGAGRPPCYVEIKNVHLKRGAAAAFPDSVTARGAKHMGELADMAETGARAVILYLVQRADCDHFAIAADIDPVYDAAARAAWARGVEKLCYVCRLSLDGIELDKPLPIMIDAEESKPSAGPESPAPNRRKP